MIVGRIKEQTELGRILKSSEAEFLTIYGRRRVGKTFLIREFFKSKCVFFEAVGMKGATLKQQLANFSVRLHNTFSPSIPLQTPSSWQAAFAMLTALIKTSKKNVKTVIFLDELPWLASKRSGLIEALDYEWNTSWSQIPQIKLIVCGSAASWMLNKLINAHGGLYNRVTKRIQLKPFSLKETAEFLKNRGLKLNPNQVLELYMILGGIPFYLRYLEKGKSISQLINDLCFQKEAPLFSEFDQLFASLFDQAQEHEAIVRALSKKKRGLSRKELLLKLKLLSGGSFKRKLDELEASCFIECYTPFGKSKKDLYFKVIDEYTLFYLNWIEPMRSTRSNASARDYWLNCSNSPSYNAWSGYAFEAVCSKHIDQIIRALRLESIATQISGWQKIGKKEIQGAQIDLLIDRSDNSTTLCEIKYSKSPFLVTKDIAKELDKRMEIFATATKTSKQLFWALITPLEIKQNLWADEIIDQTVLLADIMS